MKKVINVRGVKLTYRATFPSKAEAIKEGNKRCIKRGLLFKFYDVRKEKGNYHLYTE